MQNWAQNWQLGFLAGLDDLAFLLRGFLDKPG